MKIKLALLFAALALAGCGEGETLDVDHVLSVSDYRFTLGGQPAVTINFGGDETNHLAVSMLRADVREGFEAYSHSPENAHITADAQWRGAYFVEGPGIAGTSYYVAVESLDPQAKKATLLVAVDLSTADGARHVMMDARRFEIAGEQFDHLVTMPPHEIRPLPKTIGGKPTRQFIQAFATEYVAQFGSLLSGFESHRENMDERGFNAFRRGWLAKYSPRRKYYEGLLEKDRAALLDSGLDRLITGFIELDLSALHLWTYLRHGDKSLLEVVKTHSRETLLYLKRLDEDHRLNLKLGG